MAIETWALELAVGYVAEYKLSTIILCKIMQVHITIICTYTVTVFRPCSSFTTDMDSDFNA